MRILITSAGGPSAISVWKSLAAEHEVHMADMDPVATGLYLVPSDRRLVIPRGDDPSLVPALHQAFLLVAPRVYLHLLMPSYRHVKMYA